MKKIVTFLVVFALISMLITGLSESNVDLKSYSDDELMSLRDSISDELINRGVEFDVPFYPGMYVVGKDIRAGSYDIVLSGCGYGDSIAFYASNEDRENYNIMKFDSFDENQEGYHLTVEDGMVFDITFMNGGTMRLKSSKSPWAP